jgi:hypothetical protein
MSWTIISFRMLSLAVSASSADSVWVGSWVRRNVFSTSSRVMGRPSTTAQVSADTDAAGAADFEPHPATAPAIARARRPRLTSLPLFAVRYFRAMFR